MEILVSDHLKRIVIGFVYINRFASEFYG